MFNIFVRIRYYKSDVGSRTHQRGERKLKLRMKKAIN